MTYPTPMDIAEAEDREADKPDDEREVDGRGGHRYTGQEFITEARCVRCGYNPWFDVYRECHGRPD